VANAQNKTSCCAVVDMSDLLEIVELLGNFLNSHGVVDESVQDQLLALAGSDCFVKDALNRNRLLDICEYILLTYPQESGVTNDSDTIRLCVDIVDNIIIVVNNLAPLLGEYQDLVRYCGSLLPSTGNDDVNVIASSLRVVTHVINMCPESERTCLSVFPWTILYADCVMIVENSLDASVLNAAVYLWYCAYRQVVEPALVVAQQVGADGKCCNVDENILANALREGLSCQDDSEGGSLLTLLRAAPPDGGSDTGLVWALCLLEEIVDTSSCSCSTIEEPGSPNKDVLPSVLSITSLVHLLLGLLVAPDAALPQGRPNRWEVDGGRGGPGAPTLSREELCCVVATLHRCISCVSLSGACTAVCSWSVGDSVEQAGRLMVLCARLGEVLVEAVLMRNSDRTRLAAQFRRFEAASESVIVATTCCLKSLPAVRSALFEKKNQNQCGMHLARCCSDVLASFNEYLGLLDERDVMEWVVDLLLSQAKPEIGTSCAIGVPLDRFKMLVRNCVVLRAEIGEVVWAKAHRATLCAAGADADADALFSGLWKRFEAAMGPHV
jgi:hypothetical protein